MRTSLPIVLSSLSSLLTFAAASPATAKEDIEFVQEHLPEVAMDNRYATLPIWSGAASAERQSNAELQAGYTTMGAGNLKLNGPLLSIGGEWRLNEHWQGGGFAFYDRLSLRAAREDRDLQTLFAPSTPLVRPAPATSTGLDGTATDLGFGVKLSKQTESRLLGKHEWLFGVLWQSVKLENYRFDYLIRSGPQAGVAGTIDFDARYNHIVPFGGLSLPRDHGNWSTNAHVLIAYPQPTRGIVGHITGPGFDIRGDTADVGNGKHFGDPSVTFGYTLTYRPAHLSFDVGALATQLLLEPHVHRGIDRNALVSFSRSFD